MRRWLVLGCAGLITAGCATSPKKTVGTLDRRDPEYASRDCRQARTAVASYDDQANGRMVIGLAGNLIFPFAGTAAALAMNKVKDKDREALNQRVRRACVSDPLGRKRVARR